MEKKVVYFCKQEALSTEEFIQKLVELSREGKINRDILALFTDGKIIKVSRYSSKTGIKNALQHVEDNPQFVLKGSI